MHKFYHADRYALLSENQDIELDENQLSRFGAAYWPTISQIVPGKMDKEQLREFHLEEMRKDPKFFIYTSRLKCMFGADSLEEAISFGESIEPIPDHPIPIIEIYAENFWTLDMNWLDYTVSHEQNLDNYRHYWNGHISNHCPEKGERKPPKLEVMIALPAKAGKIVHHVVPPKVETDPQAA